MTAAKQIALRLEQGLLDRIEAHAERLRRMHPGISLSRADAVRGLLLDALNAAETLAQHTAQRAKPAK